MVASALGGLSLGELDGAAVPLASPIDSAEEGRGL